MKSCIFGGHFGSEGKGSLAEYIATCKRTPGAKLAVFGENSPNSGHTCSKGKTRNIPAASYFADVVILGPDSVIDVEVLTADVMAINAAREDWLQVYIHENATRLTHADKACENDVVFRVSSTGSGSGFARVRKQFHRQRDAIIGHEPYLLNSIPGICVVNTSQYMSLLQQLVDYDWIFECSQGALLDVNFGYFPYVTSRSTLPRVAIERNGLGGFPWTYYGVYRTYPIRTGGPSGPTGGKEIEYADLNVPPEIATVTKRTRRIFRFDASDFELSVTLTRPDVVAFTHLDYLDAIESEVDLVRWLDNQAISAEWLTSNGVVALWQSSKLGEFSPAELTGVVA